MSAPGSASPARVIWREDPDGKVRAYGVDGSGREFPASWAAQPGSQDAFTTCPVFEAIIEGNRGGGKTMALVATYLRHVGKGHGAAWRGILFRRHYRDLEDVWAKCEEIVPVTFPGARLLGFPNFKIIFPDGERLTLAQIERPDQFGGRKGHEYPWIGFEELTEWESDQCYRLMISCCRSAKTGMPRMIRATTNPAGPGHHWVKARFRLPLPPGRVVGDVIRGETDPDGNALPARVAVRSDLRENRILMRNDPDYRERIAAAATSDALRKAWLHGDWDVVAGGMFDDVWRPDHQVVPNFRFSDVPEGWYVDRSYDHGQSKPFCSLWWAESDGTGLEVPVPGGGTRMLGLVPGDLFLVHEWYGWDGSTPNKGLRMNHPDIAHGILERERDWGGGERVRPGPADDAIYDDYAPGKSVAADMEAAGVRWIRADKHKIGRKQGWQQMRKMLLGAVPPGNVPREDPGLFVCERCAQFRRTVPVLPRADRDEDDADTHAEDHAADAARYRCRARKMLPVVTRWK